MCRDARPLPLPARTLYPRPTDSQARASATVVAVPITKIPRAWNAATCSLLKIPKVKLTIAGRASITASICPALSGQYFSSGVPGGKPSSSRIGASNSSARATCCGSAFGWPSTNRFMLNGLLVRLRTVATSLRIASDESAAAASGPRPPDSEIATVRSAVDAPAIGAPRMGYSTPANFVNAVVGNIAALGSAGSPLLPLPQS